MKYKAPHLKPTVLPHLPGTSKEAPGLKQRQGSILHKALGIDASMKLHPAMVSKLLTHPNPVVSNLARKTLGMPVVSKGFKLGA